MTVYIDSLFLTNFFMNSVIIFITNIIRRREMKTFTLFISSAISAIYGCLIFFPDIVFLYSAVCKLTFSCVLIKFTFRENSFKSYIKTLSCFWFITAAAGGLIFMISSLTGFGVIMQTIVSNCIIYISLNPFILALGCILLYILTEVYRRSCIKNFTSDKSIIELLVEYLGQTYKIKGLIDTGCEAVEPLSGAPVIVAEKHIFKQKLKSEAYMKINTVSGADYLELIFPDKIECIKGGYKIMSDVVIALTDINLSDEKIYHAIINPAALEIEINDKKIKERYI